MGLPAIKLVLKGRRKKMKYKIVAHSVGSCMGNFVLEVEALMKERWVPQGGVAILEGKSGRMYMYQAMVKKEINFTSV